MSYWRSHQGGGILLIMGSSLTFALLDTCTKHATTLAPVLMLLWFRYAFQAVSTLALRWPVQKATLFSTPNPRFQMLRGALLLCTSACSFFGLQHLPVAEFTAMAMLAPMAATALAALTLKNHVSRLRWLLMLIGLGGVLLVVRPGGQVFGWALLFPLLMISSYASFQVITSRLSGDENPYTTHFYTGLVGALISTPVALMHWDSAALLQHWPWFLAIGAMGTFGHLLLIRAFNRASAVVLTPYSYTQIAFATLTGWLAFGQAPDLPAWIGMAVIAAGGVGSARVSIRELALRRQ